MIPVYEPSLGDEELDNVVRAVQSGWISSKGRFIPEFEAAFAHYIGVAHGVACSNGTTALHLALTALGIHAGDEVLVPTLTFVATANVVLFTGATPVFVDADPTNWCIDPQQLEDVITPRTKAIIPVHLYGNPCDMRALMPEQFFLMPGVGAQGGDASLLGAAFDEQGLGALVAASRSVAYAWKERKGMDWREAATAAARELKEAVNATLPAK